MKNIWQKYQNIVKNKEIANEIIEKSMTSLCFYFWSFYFLWDFMKLFD